MSTCQKSICNSFLCQMIVEADLALLLIYPQQQIILFQPEDWKNSQIFQAAYFKFLVILFA